MVLVSIDVDAARDVVTVLRAYAEQGLEEWTQVADAARHALVEVHTLRGLSDPLEGIARLAGELETRVELAVAYNTGASGVVLADPVLTYRLPGAVESIEAVKGQLGVELAQGLKAISPYGKTLRRDDVRRFAAYTAQLAKYANDAAIMTGYFGELGPEGVVGVPIMLKDFAASYQQQLGSLSEGDLRWDEDTPMSTEISEQQQTFLESFGTGLGTATDSVAFRREHSDFGDGLVTAATQSQTGAGWGLSQVLRYGTYEGQFLKEVGTGLYNFEREREQGGEYWSGQLNGEVQNWRVGTKDSGQCVDPFVGLFDAMSRTPAAAGEFFHPTGDLTGDRSKYLIQDRSWHSDDMNALGKVLDAAATAFRGPNDPPYLQEQSAWVASAAINYLGAREDPMFGHGIGDRAKDSLGHLLATYIVDVDGVANGRSEKLGAHENVLADPWMIGQPVGAGFGKDSLRIVLSDVLTDEGAVTAVSAASSAWNANRINHAVHEWSEDPDELGQLNSAVSNGSRTTGFILATMGVGLKAEAKDLDERATLFLDLGASVVDMVPMGGKVTSFAANELLGAGKDSLMSRWAGNESEVEHQQMLVRDAAATDLRTSVVVAMAEQGKLPWSSTENDPRLNAVDAPYDWFPGGVRFDATKMNSPLVRAKFEEWMHTGDVSSSVQGILLESEVAFDDGTMRGLGTK